MILKTSSLPKSILEVIHHKGTEPPFTGEYDQKSELGTYLCRQCGLALFRATAKFAASCGWPSFDEEIAGTVLIQPDRDGFRKEILCLRCKAHLGHVFYNEYLTTKNTRYCVNSLSLDFVSSLSILDTQEAIFAAGCFWGVQYYFDQLTSVLKTEVGYTGGNVDLPTYEEVCGGTTRHYEAIRIIYDPQQINYQALVKYFFEIHNPTQSDGQGPDKGSQYLSAIFYYTEDQYSISLQVIQRLKELGYEVKTKILPVSCFWRAESYHQKYYYKHDKLPYCHRYEKKF